MDSITIVAVVAGIASILSLLYLLVIGQKSVPEIIREWIHKSRVIREAQISNEITASDVVKFESTYKQNLARELGNLYTEGVDQTRVKLENVFVKPDFIEIIPADNEHSNTSAPKLFDLPYLYTEVDGSHPTLLKILNDKNHIVLLGEQGSGKTTLLQYIACTFAEHDLQKTIAGSKKLVPIFANLKNYDGNTLLLDYLVGSVGLYGQFVLSSNDRTMNVSRQLVNLWLHRSELIILLDGLDEVKYENRKSVITSVERFISTIAGQNNHLVISCRVSSYQETRGLGESFTHYLLKPLEDNSKALYFIKTWLAALKPGLRKIDIIEETTQISSEIRKYPLIEEVSHNPLLLRLAIALWLETHKFESNRTELFRRYFEEVLVKRERIAGSNYSHVWNNRQIEIALRKVAWELQLGRVMTSSELNNLLESIGIGDGLGLLQHLRERLGLLSLQGYKQGEIIGFRLQAFQEYFFALELAPLLLDKSASDLHITEDIKNFVFDILTRNSEYASFYPRITKDNMILIPRGPAIFGQEDSVIVKNIDYDYFIDKTPVTNGQYFDFIKSTGHKPPRHWKNGEPPVGLEDHPVVYVTWYDCIKYAKWRGKRLPTEQEWEKAARGIDGRSYAWGDVFNFNLANTSENGLISTTSIGTFSGQGDSPYGLVDICGNVLEWTSSSYNDNGKSKVLKGGAFNYDKTYARLSRKVGYHPGLTHNHFGFRLCMSNIPNQVESTLFEDKSIDTYIEDIVEVDVINLAERILENNAELIVINDETRRQLHSVLVDRAADYYSFARQKKHDFPKMTFIPSGEFIMGGDEIGNEAIRIARIDYSYLIDIFPVTNLEYREFIDWLQKANSHDFCHKNEPKDKNHSPEIFSHHLENGVPLDYFTNPEYNAFPVVCIDWWDAYAFANWAGKRLPYEKEWEKAARGIDGRIYSYGDEFDFSKCNVKESGLAVITPVNKYPNGVSPFGCFDMNGNIWEWCLDKFDTEDQSEDTPRIVKGGSYVSDGDKIHSAYRNGRLPTDRWVSRGFRCVKVYKE